MSYDDKIKAARALLEKYNKSLPKDFNILNVEQIFKELSTIGGQTEEALRRCKYEDLEFCGFPRLLARQTAETIFRTESDNKPTHIKMSLARAMNVEQLVKAYDPREPDNNVGKILSEKAKNESFIVFGDGGSINQEATISLLNELRDGHDARQFYTVDGIPCEVYAVGDRPDHLGSINPLFPAEVLRPDGTCSQTNRSWQGIDDEIRKILLLAKSETNEFVLNSIQDAHNILDLVITDKALTKVRQRFPKAVIRLKQLRDEGNEPSLRKPIGKNRTSRSNDPFYGSKHTRS